ncbi:MAG: hypothetical protein NZ894_05250, partial [Archaeoglobaceae archaeon]|nr:hypothetical protein [Archaeoglobaceae archaeon]
KLFYLSDEGLYFTNQPNLNRVLVTREENVPEEKIYEEELNLLKKNLSTAEKFKVYIHPRFSRDLADTEDLKLVVLDKSEPDKDILEKNSEVPRIYKNTLIFLCEDKDHRETFSKFMKTLIALRSIKDDKKLKLSETQKRALNDKLKDYESRVYEELRKLYRHLFLPARVEFKKIDLGIPSYGEKSFENEIFERLKSEGEILEKISAKLLRDKYLLGDYLEISKLYKAFLTTPGELRIISKEGFVEGIKEGVKSGLFGFGYLSEGKIVPQMIRREPKIELLEEEIIIKPELFIETEERPPHEVVKKPKEEKKVEKEPETFKREKETIKVLRYRLGVPPTKISAVAQLVNFLKSKFRSIEIEI